MNTRGGWQIVLWMLMALGAAGCASTAATSESSVQWRRGKGAPGCVGSDSRWDLADQISIRLEPELQASLMEQLKAQPLEDPLCWYQIPSGDLLLRAGSFCDLSREAQFHRDGSRWSLVRVEHILGQCGTS